MMSSILKLFAGGPTGPIVGNDWILKGISLQQLDKQGYINLPSSKFPIKFKDEFQDSADDHRTGPYYRRALRMQDEIELIHPIFDRSRWWRIDKNDYQLLVPSLMLASRILDEPHILPYIKGFLTKPLTRVNDAATEKEAGQPLYTFQSENLNAWHSEETWRTLKSMKQNIIFRFLPFHKDDVDDDTMGVTNDAPEDSTIVPGACKAIITFNKELLDVLQHKLKASNISRRWKPGTDAKSAYLRTQLLFAITAVHEVLHAIWRVNNAKYSSTDPTITSAYKQPFEPFWRDQRMNELGNAWEGQVFGGTFWPIGTPKSAAVPYGLFSLPFPGLTRVPPDDTVIERGEPEEWGVNWSTMYPVEMEFVRSLFTHEKWREVQRYGIRRLRRTKKLGCRARLVNPDVKPAVLGVTSPPASVGSLEGEQDNFGVVRRP
ncbi:hypothetical protein D6C79_09177 [Aureobasidium pullulans]|nr:hypothetical protein D6C79_09177 [Aureobasidium pullulans]